MKFVVAGGGVAGLAAALGVARAGHEAVVLERDAVKSASDPQSAFRDDRRGIPHFFQPHAFIRDSPRAGTPRKGGHVRPESLAWASVPE